MAIKQHRLAHTFLAQFATEQPNQEYTFPSTPHFQEQKRITHHALHARFDRTSESVDFPQKSLIFSLGSPKVTCSFSPLRSVHRDSLGTVPDTFPHTYVRKQAIEFTFTRNIEQELQTIPYLRRAFLMFIFQELGEIPTLLTFKNSFFLEVREDRYQDAHFDKMLSTYLKLFFWYESFIEQGHTLEEMPYDLWKMTKEDILERFSELPQKQQLLARLDCPPLFISTVEGEARFEEQVISFMRTLGITRVFTPSDQHFWTCVETIIGDEKVFLLFSAAHEAGPLKISLYGSYQSLLLPHLRDKLTKFGKEHSTLPESLYFTYFKTRDCIHELLDAVLFEMEYKQELLIEDIHTWLHMALFFRGDFGPIFTKTTVTTTGSTSEKVEVGEYEDEDEHETELDTCEIKEVDRTGQKEHEILQDPKGYLQRAYVYIKKCLPPPPPRKVFMQTREKRPDFATIKLCNNPHLLSTYAAERRTTPSPLNTMVATYASKKAIRLFVQEQNFFYAGQEAADMGNLSEARYYFLQFVKQTRKLDRFRKYAKELFELENMLKKEEK